MSKLAVVQTSPIFLDREKTIGKAVSQVADAAVSRNLRLSSCSVQEHLALSHNNLIEDVLSLRSTSITNDA